MGDDIRPATPDFFRCHASRHAQNLDTNLAVLGTVAWPDDVDFAVNFTMRQIQEGGWQFAFSQLSPLEFASWKYFYTANVSVKRSVVEDWASGGFDETFPSAALEDIEFGYQLWKSPGGLRLLYEPT